LEEEEIMDKKKSEKRCLLWQKALGYFSGLWLSGMCLAHGAQREVADHSIELYSHGFLILSKEINQKILETLSPLELVRFGQTSKATCLISEAESLWIPLYKTERMRLLPFLKIQESFPLSFCSHKSALGITTILHHCFVGSHLPNYFVLKDMIRKAIPKGGYKDLLLACLYALEGNQGRYESQAYKLLCLCPDRLVQAIYWGQGRFEKESKAERFHLLEEACQENIPNAFMYKLSAMVSGDIDERAPLERFEDLYQLVLSGDKRVSDQIICQALLDGKGFGQENRSLEERFKDLEILALKGNSWQAKSIIINALYQGTYYRDYLSEEERFARLRAYVEMDPFSPAIHHVVSCLVDGKLGQEKRPEAMRFDDLVALIGQEGGWVGFSIIKAVVNGDLGQKNHSFAKRFKFLEELAFQEQKKRGNDKTMGAALVDIIIKGQELGLQEKSSLERFRYLEALSSRGLLAAQEAVVDILFQKPKGTSQFHISLDFSQEERGALLKTYTQQGYAGSQSAMIKAIYSGDLGQKEKSIDERCQQLKFYADLKIPLAQKYLDEVIENGGFTNSCRLNPFYRLFHPNTYPDKISKDFSLSPALLFSLRLEKAEQGDKKARNWVYESLYEGTYDQDKKDPIIRFSILKKKALAGDGEALVWVIKALVLKKLCCKSLSDTVLFDELNFWALRGNEEAQEQIVEALYKGLLGQAHRSMLDRFQHLQELLQQGNPYALDTVCDFLKVGIPPEIGWSKIDRIQELERLSIHGYDTAQSTLVCSLLGDNYGFWHSPDALTPGDFEESLEDRFEMLKAYGDSGNALARSAIMNCLGGYSIHREFSLLDNIFERSFPSILKWIAQGDFSLVHGVLDVLQKQASKEEETILKVEDVRNLFHLYKIFVSPTLDEFNQMVQAVLASYST
jgi:hypothetical protein